MQGCWNKAQGTTAAAPSAHPTAPSLCLSNTAQQTCGSILQDGQHTLLACCIVFVLSCSDAQQKAIKTAGSQVVCHVAPPTLGAAAAPGRLAAAGARDELSTSGCHMLLLQAEAWAAAA
jgi:hypothetical protein